MKKKNKSKIKNENKNKENDKFMNKKGKRESKENEGEGCKEKNPNTQKKKDNINDDEGFQSNPKNIKYKIYIIQDSIVFGRKNFSFIVFKSILYIIYGTYRNSIIFYNLLDKKNGHN